MMTSKRQRRRTVVLGLATAIVAFGSGALHLSPGAEPITFVGLATVSEADARGLIRAQLESIDERGASAALADDAAFFLERALRERGYAQADVVPVYDAGARAITLRVDEGTASQLGAIKFEGNTAAAPEAELRARITRATLNRSGRGFFASGALPFVERDIEAGLAEVATYYQSLGYLDATAAPLADSARRSADGRTVDLLVSITSGPIYTIGNIAIPDESGEDADALRERLLSFVGRTATTETTSELRNAVLSFYRDRGHYRSVVGQRATRRESTVDIEFDVDKGERFLVGDINFAGNERIDTGFLVQRFSAIEGRPYSIAKTERIYRELLSAGLLNSISIVPDERADGTVDLGITVEEAKMRELAVTLGYGTFEGAIVGGSWQQRNLFGTGRQLRAGAEMTSRGVAGDLTYHDRWLFDTDLQLTASLFSIRKEMEGYDKFENGLRAELTWPVNSEFKLGAFGRFSHTDIYEAEIDDSFLGDRLYRVGSLGLSASYDTRDDPARPREGSFLSGVLEYGSDALGGEVEFFRGTLRLTHHIPIGERSDLRLGARTGFVSPSGDSEDFPIDLRFFSGGATSVRSFRERYLGPGDGAGHPIGGEFFTTLNAEYTFPLVGILKGAVFADAGNLLSEAGDASFDDMHYAAGLGLRIDLPTGPLRMDYGFNLNQGDGEPSGTFHIAVGLSF